MKFPRMILLVLAIVIVASLTWRGVPGFQRVASSAAQPAASAGGPTARAVAAAKSFLATLDDQKRAKALLALRRDLRSRWSNLPTGTVMQVDRDRTGGPFERNGVKLGELNPRQQEAALALVATTLSRAGYQKVIDIVNGDQVLETTSAPTRPAGNRVRFGRAEYYLAILGAPSLTDQWMIQFGGHHLALNVTLVGKSNVLTPSHTGAQPTTYTLDGRTIRPLGNETDKAFALVNALDAAQQKQAMLNYKIADLVVGAGEDGKVIQAEGVRASGFTAAQQAMLVDLTNEWVSILDDAEASARMAEVKANLPNTYFAWSGPTTKEGGAYFRVQGPTVLIEYAPQNTRGNDGLPNHIHTLYRDPTNDYAARLVKP